MNIVILMLLTFVAVGLVRDRLGQRWSYAIVGLVILAYVAYAYRNG